MVDRDEVVGRPTEKAVITVERGPVMQFATSVTETSAVYQDRDAAKAAGFDDIPVPPTYFFSAAGHWGAFPEDQPEDNPAKQSSPVTEIIGGLMAKGGIILHGEQEFVYHRPVVVGERLRSDGKVADFYTKESGDKTMTFLVTENEYRDESGELVLTSRMNLIHRI